MLRRPRRAESFPYARAPLPEATDTERPTYYLFPRARLGEPFIEKITITAADEKLMK